MSVSNCDCSDDAKQRADTTRYREVGRLADGADANENE